MSHNPYKESNIKLRYVNLYPQGTAQHFDTKAEADEAHEAVTGERLGGRAHIITFLGKTSS